MFKPRSQRAPILQSSDDNTALTHALCILLNSAAPFLGSARASSRMISPSRSDTSSRAAICSSTRFETAYLFSHPFGAVEVIIQTTRHRDIAVSALFDEFPHTSATINTI